MDMSEILMEKVNDIAILKIDRPKAYNALSKKIVNQIDNCIEEIAKDQSIKILIIHSDNNFAAGADIKEMIECNEEEAKEFSFSETFNKLAELDIPTIAAIEGYALGGGLELALTCDLRIAALDAKLGFPEITLGIMPGAGGTVRTPRIISPAKAKELIFLGETINATEAYQMGLVNIVVEKAEVFPLAMKWAERLSSFAPMAVAAAKKAINEGMKEANIKKAIDLEAYNWAKLFNTEDQKEGMKAFSEKRKANYKGK